MTRRVDGRDVVAVAFGIHREKVLPAETTRQRPVEQHHLQPPGVRRSGEVRDFLLRPRLPQVLPEHERRAPNPAVVALPVVAVPHAAVDAPQPAPARHPDVPEHRVIRTEEREQSRFSAQRSRHLIHDAARSARDCVLAQLAERRELRAALVAVEGNVREDGERAHGRHLDRGGRRHALPLGHRRPHEHRDASIVKPRALLLGQHERGPGDVRRPPRL